MDLAHRILVDLSPAREGFAGIAHETRLMLDMLWQSGSFAPTGLLYDQHLAAVTHRFTSSSWAARRLENHADFLFKVAERSAAPESRAARLLQLGRTFRAYLRHLVRLGGRMHTLDNQVHGESAWRLFLAPSLAEGGLALARQCPMQLANLSRRLLKLSALMHLPRLTLDTAGFDFLLLHEAFPLRARPETCKLVRYYDMIPALRPELVGSRAQIKAHLRGIRRCAADSVFVCNSEPTRADLLGVFPELEERAVTIPHLLSDLLKRDPAPRMLPSICRQRSGGRRDPGRQGKFPPYLLMVSTLEPRKNHVGLIRAYEKLLARRDTDLILIFVGGPGWKNDEIHKAMQPLVRSRRLYHLSDVPPQELRVLYTHAEAVVFPSTYEGFGYCPLEAMQCGTPAIVSDIAAHRWVYGNAALYVNPFDTDDLSAAIERLLFGNHALRQQLIERGTNQIRRYSYPAIARQWLSLCEEIKRQGGGAKVRQLKLANLRLPSQDTLDFCNRAAG
jgi:glycosyltransferase involved in cell wall biosynthesis